ncbi:MAG: peptidyl-prolyl cis-trans isomerase [Clostridia bacterium]|nr:peptidyl-prolyl cis-trans isomerase [Clostridia bacterium]
MNAYKRILALIAAFLLALSLTGCLTPKDESKETPAPDAPTAAPDAPTDAPSGNSIDANIDRDAVAIELGDVIITAGEISDVFDQYIGLFSYSGSVDQETVAQCLDMSVEYVLQYYVPVWKAKELGITLTEEEEAEIETIAAAEVAEEREGLICQFAYYYGITDDFPESEAALTEEELSAVMDAISAELAEVFYPGYTFEEYLDSQYESYRNGARVDLLTERVKQQAEQNLTLDDETVDAWYAKTLETQQALFDATPSEYRYAVDAFDSGESLTPLLYTPAGFARIQVLEFIPDSDPDVQIDLNKAEMERLEAEYGALAMKGEDEARQAEIKAEYDALLEENRKLEEAYYASIISDVEAANAALKGGMSFEDAMDTYNRHEEGESGLDERLIYVGGADARYGDLAAEAAKLNAGEVSEPVSIDGAYYIIRMIGTLPAGVTDRASIETDIRAAADAASREDAWDALFDSWLAEAKDVAVFHPETYEHAGDIYLYY